MLSGILPTIVVKLIGLWLPELFLSPFIKIRVIFAALQPAGTMPRLRDTLNKDVRASTISLFVSSSILGYVLSGPGHLLVFRPLVAFRTSSAFISKFGNVCFTLVNGALPVSLLLLESLFVMRSPLQGR